MSAIYKGVHALLPLTKPMKLVLNVAQDRN